MAVLLPHVKEQLKKLNKDVPWTKAKNSSSIIVDLRIGDLSHKEMGKALYLVGNAFVELTNKQKIIVKIINDSLKDFIKIIDNKDLSREEIINQISHLVRDPDSGVVRSLKETSLNDKEY